MSGTAKIVHAENKFELPYSNISVIYGGISMGNLNNLILADDSDFEQTFRTKYNNEMSDSRNELKVFKSRQVVSSVS